jgi:hypothetical protein
MKKRKLKIKVTTTIMEDLQIRDSALKEFKEFKDEHSKKMASKFYFHQESKLQSY